MTAARGRWLLLAPLLQHLLHMLLLMLLQPLPRSPAHILHEHCISAPHQSLLLDVPETPPLHILLHPHMDAQVGLGLKLRAHLIRHVHISHAPKHP